ncbi:A-kinase anchor protein 12 [Pungitius pungitius]|uniref:A-kinase anchor protein 12 n=1 Tax=Pungitius pungitius TaxID=134920 RepID=UPI002E10F537
MGDAQSAPREGEEDAADGEESGKVDDAQTQRNIEDKPLKNKGQISEINGKDDSSKAEVNGHCENEVAAKAVLSPDEDVSQTETPLKEETLLENAEINEKESPNEADVNEDIPLEITEMNAKQNDINESFRRFFSNIGLKLTVKRGSGEIPKDVPNDTNKEEPNRPDRVEDTTKEQNTDVNMAKESCDNDSTTCPTLTDVTSEEVLENAEEKEVETKVEVESDNGNAAMTSPPGGDVNRHTTTEQKPRSTSLSTPKEEVVVLSPVKRFFTSGLFSGLRKKKKPAEDETMDKEMNDSGKKEVVQNIDGTVQDQQEDKEDIGLGVDAAAVETDDEEHELKGEILLTAQPLDASTDSSSIFVIAPELLSSQEKDKVQASPMKRLLLGSNLKKLSKKQRSRRSSDAKVSNSEEHETDHLLSSTEKAENQKEEVCVQPSRETAGEEEGAWASFKKLVTPKKRLRKCSLSSEGTQIPDSAEEQKPSEGGQVSDHSTEEGKKRKDSSVSWESVLCGSARIRSRKTSDSEDETPQIEIELNLNKPDGGSKLDVKNEVDEMFAHSSKQAGGPSEGNGASTWQSLKRLVTPKRKAKGEDESKDDVQSDSDVTQDEASLSRKKLLPRRKKRKSAKKQDQVSSDETDKEAASGEEDSDTPAVVPLSEFDTDETEVCIQPHADVESLLPNEADSEIQQDPLDPKAEPVLTCDNLISETKKAQGNNGASENQATTTRAGDEEPDDLTESISKQQLSDIPEEATPASVTEEAARDDTIADDLIEITSEAITAAEHLDITLADETEMISAVSQLSSESSKTSGNTTPVPAQYVVEETDVLLYQVVETISGSPEAFPVCSYELRSEGTAFSVSHQILETFVKEEPTILELHRSLEATEIDTDLKLVELDTTIEGVNTTQMESIFEVNDSVSTEVVSEVPTEEFNTAEMTEDEVKEVDVAHPEYVITELEDVEENINELAEVDETAPDKGSLVEACQIETEPPKLDSQEADFAAKVADETIDGATEQEVRSEDLQQPVEVEYLPELANEQTLKLINQCVPSLEKDITSEVIPAGETITNELKDELETYALQPEHVHVPEEPEAEKASTSDPEEGSLQSPTEDVKSEDTLPAETVTDEPNLEDEHLTGVSVDPENQEVDPMKTVQSLQGEVISDTVPGGETDDPQKETLLLTETNPEPVDASATGQDQEVLNAVHATEIASKEGSVQSFEKELISVPDGETSTGEPKHSAEVLTDGSVEPENQELRVISMKKGRAPKPDSEDESIGSLEEEFLPVNVPEGETDEPTEETTRLPEANRDPVDASKTEHVQESEVLEADPQTRLDSEEVRVSSEREETKSEDVPLEESVTDEPKQSAEVLPEVSVEPENEELQANDMKMIQVTETPEVIQTPILDSEGDVQTFEKEVISEILDKKADEPKEGTICLSEDVVVPVDAYQTEHVKPKALPAPTLDSEEGSMPSPDEDVKSEDIPTAETVSDKPEESAEILPEVSVEPENKELVKVMETIHATEEFDAVQAPTLDSEVGIAQSLSLNLPQEEPVPNEPNEIEKPLTEVCVEPVDASESQQPQEPEVIQSVQAAAADPEECSAQSLEKKLIADDVTEGETVTEEPKQEAFSLTEANLERMDPSTTGQETQVLQAEPAAPLDSEGAVLLSHGKEVISGDIPVVESITDGPEQENEVEPEKIPIEAPKTEHAQEPEALASDVMDRLTETKMAAGTSTSMQVVTESVEGGTTLLDDVPKPDIGRVVASVTDEGVAPPEPSLEKTESTARDTGMLQEDHMPIVIDELLTSTAACASEKTVLTEDTPASGADNAAVTNETKHAEHPSAARAADEGPKESERSDTEVKTSPVEHAAVAPVVVCNVKDVSVAIPDISIEQTSPVTEPLREIVTRELMSKEHVETSAPMVPDEEAVAAEESSAVVTMHVPSVELEDNHRIQVQVVGHDMKSAESRVDAVLEVGITQVKEVIDACHGDAEEVSDHYATPQIEEEFIHEHDKATIEGVILHAKENLPEKEAGTPVVNVEQEGVEQPDAVTEESEAGESESAFSPERQESTVIRDVAEAEDLMLTADIPARLHVPVHPQGDESEETKADELKEAQTIQTPVVTPANTEVISSIGNVDSSPSLSIELKLNISFGQANKPASPPPTTERSGPANEADMSEVGVHAVAVEPVKTAKQIELAGVAVQGTANTDAAENMDSKERCVIASQPVLLHISIQAMEAEGEEMKSPETVTSSVQATEAQQPVRQTETTEVFPTHTVLSEACEQQTEAKKPANQNEEDQDVWMDAEEDVCTQEKTEACRLQLEEPPREAEAGLKPVVEMEEESQQKMPQTAERCGTDSECEDFAFAPELPESETVRVTTME